MEKVDGASPATQCKNKMPWNDGREYLNSKEAF